MPAFSQTVTAGLWKARTELTVNSVPMPAVPTDDCLGEKDAKNIRNYIQENLIPETSCRITKWDFKKPTLKASLSCDGKQGHSQGSLHGKLTEKSFRITGTLEGEHALLGAVNIDVLYTGDYMKACK